MKSTWADGIKLKLEIKKVVVEDSGMYECVAINDYGRTRKIVNLQVLGTVTFSFYLFTMSKSCMQLCMKAFQKSGTKRNDVCICKSNFNSPCCYGERGMFKKYPTFGQGTEKWFAYWGPIPISFKVGAL